MNTKLQMLISTLPYYVPTLFVCIAALAIIVNQWRKFPEASMWASLGFGLLLLLSICGPIMQVMLQSWVIQDGHHQDRAWAFSLLSLFRSLSNAAVFALLLTAIYAGRSKHPAQSPESASPKSP